ncbi:ATP-binding protein [Streptomyces lydicus]|uniref:ATP-binding protein n=1 Tax=Streptomyces lydicus TaxID=47763 RepID=UPI0036F004C9
MSSSYRLSSWTEIARPHEDVAAGVLDMGTYAANLSGVFRGRKGISPVYADAARFYQATYLTEKMRELLTDVVSVLAGGTGSHVLQLRTPFGGGKTHSLVALLHLVRNRAASLAACPELKDIADPGDVRVAVLSGEELDALTPMTATGTKTHTLWGEFAAQLGRYELVKQHDLAGAAPGGDVLRQVIGDSPTLILLDEVLIYVEKAMVVSKGESNAGRQAMLFLQSLTEVVSAQPNAAMVYSLQASVGEAVGAEGLLSDLDKLVARVDAKREPVAGDEVLRVVQRRLFAELGDETIHQEVARSYSDLLRKQLLATAETGDARREADAAADSLEERILAAYPFHPELLDLMYHRWGSLVSYQRTRGALQFLAAVVHALWRSGAQSPLVGPGDVDFSDESTRGAFFSQVGERERYASVLASDVTSGGAGCATVDRTLGADSPMLAQLRIGTRVASAIMLYSFGAREGEDRGVLETDLVRSVLVPGLTRNVVVSALHDLREEELYLHYTGRRYRFEPTPNLTKLVRDEATKLSSKEVLAEVRGELEKQLQGNKGVALWPEAPGGIADERPLFTVAYLHPDWSEDRDPQARFIEQAGKGSPRRYRNGLALVLPDKGQFDLARHAVRLRLAAETLLAKARQYNFSPEQIEELREKAGNARRDGSVAISAAYSTVTIPTRSRTGDAPYVLESADLRTMLAAGRALHERVVEALSQRVFSSITPAKLVALAGLGPDRKAVTCGDLVDWFYSYYDFTKLWGKKAIASAIAKAVSESELGYVVGVVREDAEIAPRDARQVRFGDRLAADEIDLSDDAAILWRDYAQKYVQAAAEPTAQQPESRAEARPQPTPSAEPAKPQGGTQGGGDPATGVQSDVVRAADVKATIERSGVFNLNRALSWLRGEAGPVRIEISIHAEGEFDRGSFRNGFLEPLEEATEDLDINTQ